jgi:hypothetical protein
MSDSPPPAIPATGVGPVESLSAGESSRDPFRAFQRAVAEFGEATSRELEAQRRLHRLAWAAFLSVPLGFLGSNFLILGIANSISSGNGSLSSILLGVGFVLWGTVGVVLFLGVVVPRWGRGRPSASNRGAAESKGSPTGLQKATEELVRIQVEVDRMRRQASDTVLLLAILLILLGGLASNLVSLAFPQLSWITALALSDTAFGTVAILWAVFYWRATLRRTRRMESRARTLTQGLAHLEEALWSRF